MIDLYPVSSSLQRLETNTVNIERRLTSIRQLLDKSQLPDQPTLSGPAINPETNFLKYKLSGILMKHAEAATPWNAIGIKEWINAGRWWLFKVSKPTIFPLLFIIICILILPNMR